MGSHGVGHDWGNLACMHNLEKEMATHSSVLAWRIPGMGEPGGMSSVGSHRVRHDWSDLACLHALEKVVHGVAKSRTQLSDFTLTFHFHALEKEMATHSSVLTWRIPGMGEPGGLPSMGLHRVGHNWSDLAAAAACYIDNWLAIEVYVLYQLTI